ncbi:MAG: hypothetical protein AAF743_04080, partial [Planctomycetota bacterium]
KAAYLHVRARWRQWRGDVDPRYEAKLAVCEKCPLRTARGGVFYCGAPVWERLVPLTKSATAAGCGCPLHVKARDRESHCPLTIDGHDLHEIGMAKTMVESTAETMADTAADSRDWMASNTRVSDTPIDNRGDGVDSHTRDGQCMCKWCHTVRDNPSSRLSAAPDRPTDRSSSRRLDRPSRNASTRPGPSDGASCRLPMTTA